MRRAAWLPWIFAGIWCATAVAACAAGRQSTASGAGSTGAGAGVGTGGAGGSADAVTTTASTGSGGEGASIEFDAGGGGSELQPDAACATATEVAETSLLPVDIIWMIDNSASMASAIAEVQAGLNSFAALIAAKDLDYRVVMLSLRSPTSSVVVNGGTRYPICIPPPLSGDATCGDGPQFVHSSIDVRSTQPLEQLLGTLGQTEGFQPGDDKGGEPWAYFLRPEATKTMVIVTDDNARLSATDFETFAGGQNPFNSTKLPPGILDPSWNGLFQDYMLSGLYGWGSEVDPSVKCTFPDQSQPASSGPTYTTLVTKTGGVRAKICDGEAAWEPFFDAVASAVVTTSKLTCELGIPEPSMGSIDYAKINVIITGGPEEVKLFHVEDAAACGPDGGWYYDDPAMPTKVLLCPASCDQVNDLVGPDKPGEIQIQFGCETIIH
jgi:hypothetical protein